MSVQFFPHQITAAVDAICLHRETLIEAAWRVASGQPNSLNSLEEALHEHALLLRAFHLVFDGTADPRVHEDRSSLFAWAAEYDRNFNDAHLALI